MEIDPSVSPSISAQDEEEEPEGPTPEMIAEYERRQNAMFTGYRPKAFSTENWRPSPAQGRGLPQILELTTDETCPTTGRRKKTSVDSRQRRKKSSTLDFWLRACPTTSLLPKKNGLPGRAPATSVAVRTPGPAGNKQASSKRKGTSSPV